MNATTLRNAIAGCALVAALGAAISIGGPLDPPAGPIASTYKTLTEIEPRVLISDANTPGDAGAVFRITQPGSYYLGANVVGGSGKAGIVIATDNVTIDLNGFQLIGGEGTLEGICITAPGSRLVTVRNGSVRGWGGNGVCTENVSGSVLLDLRVWGNSGDGIKAGPSAVVRNCTSQQNGGVGILVGNNGLVAQCTAQENTGAGFDLANGSTMTGCTSGNNALDGVVAATGCTISGTTARANGGGGFVMNFGCTADGCSASFNALDGFYATGSGVSIRTCTAEANTRDGIRATGDCMIVGNNCDSNGFGQGDGAGIHTLGAHNRVERNNATDGDRGIQVDGIRSLIIGNSVGDNTVDFAIAPNNLTGVIVTTEAALNAASSNANVVY